MSKFILQNTSSTPTATGDAATTLANNTYLGAIQGGTSLQRVNILEIYLGGQAGASTPSIITLARDSTVGATLTGLTASTQTNAILEGSGTQTFTTVFFAATTPPQRSTTLHLLNLSFNAFGGIVRWMAAPGEEISIVGNAASLGEVSLSAYTGGTTGLMGSHIIYEPF